jgi:hypothetical protein
MVIIVLFLALIVPRPVAMIVVLPVHPPDAPGK